MSAALRHFESPALATPDANAPRPTAAVTPSAQAGAAAPAAWDQGTLGEAMPALYSPPATATRSFHLETVLVTPFVDGIFYHVSVLCATRVYIAVVAIDSISVSMVSLLPERAIGDTLRARILRYIADHGNCSRSEIARNLGVPISNVRERLWVARQHGHVTETIVRAITPYGAPTMKLDINITEEGKKWLALAEQS